MQSSRTPDVALVIALQLTVQPSTRPSPGCPVGSRASRSVAGGRVAGATGVHKSRVRSLRTQKPPNLSFSPASKVRASPGTTSRGVPAVGPPLAFEKASSESGTAVRLKRESALLAKLSRPLCHQQARVTWSPFLLGADLAGSAQQRAPLGRHRNQEYVTTCSAAQDGGFDWAPRGPGPDHLPWPCGPRPWRPPGRCKGPGTGVHLQPVASDAAAPCRGARGDDGERERHAGGRRS